MEEWRRSLGATPEEVIERLKDDGDFDTLRLKIINQVKQNEELRNYILKEVAQSDILSQAGSENLKPGQLSDAVYQELGKKVTGRISDEIWKVIMSNNINEDISETVESAYSRILNPTAKDVGHHSSSSATVDTSKRIGISAAPSNEDEATVADKTELQMPPGFAISNPNKEVHREHLPRLPSEKEVHNAMSMVDDADDMPPGFAIPSTSACAVKVSPGMSTLADADKHPGFGTSGDVDVDTPPGFSNGAGAGDVSVGAMPPGVGGAGIAGADAEDDPVVPPGFG